MPSPPPSNRDSYDNQLHLYGDDNTVTELEDRSDTYSEGDENPVSDVKGVLRVFGIPVIYTPALDGWGDKELPDDVRLVVDLPPPPPPSFKALCKNIRTELEWTLRHVRYVMRIHPDLISLPFIYDQNPLSHQRSEMEANLDLAYRALEEARMRFGMVLQASDKYAKETP